MRPVLSTQRSRCASSACRHSTASPITPSSTGQNSDRAAEQRLAEHHDADGDRAERDQQADVLEPTGAAGAALALPGRGLEAGRALLEVGVGRQDQPEAGVRSGAEPAERRGEQERRRGRRSRRRRGAGPARGHSAEQPLVGRPERLARRAGGGGGVGAHRGSIVTQRPGPNHEWRPWRHPGPLGLPRAPGANQGSPRWCAAPRWPRIGDMNQTQGPSARTSSRAARPRRRAWTARTSATTRSCAAAPPTARSPASPAASAGTSTSTRPSCACCSWCSCFFGGAGFVAYGAAWLLVPEDGQDEGTIAMNAEHPQRRADRRRRRRRAAPARRQLGRIGFPWPLFLVGIGVLIYLAFRDKGPRPSTPGRRLRPGPRPGVRPVPDPGRRTRSTRARPTRSNHPLPRGRPYRPAGPAYQPPRPKRGPKLFGFTLALVAVALGALGLTTSSGGSVVDPAYPALALTVVGADARGRCLRRSGRRPDLPGPRLRVRARRHLGRPRGRLPGTASASSVAPTSASSVRTDYYDHVGTGRRRPQPGERPRSPRRTRDHVDGRRRRDRRGPARRHRSDVDAGIDGPGQIDLPDPASGGINTDLDGIYGAGPAPSPSTPTWPPDTSK